MKKILFEVQQGLTICIASTLQTTFGTHYQHNASVLHTVSDEYVLDCV